MKTGTYKRQNGKVVEIEINSNDNSNLVDNDPLTALLAEYQTIFNHIDKGSNVVNFVKTKEYKQGLLDCLQETIAKLIDSKEYENHVNIKGLLRKAFYNRTIDNLRYESTYLIFKQDFSEYCQDMNYGVTKQYLNEMMLTVKQVLSEYEYKIFKLYHIKGFTIKDIAKQYDSSYSDIQRTIVNIGNKIVGTEKRQGLKFSCLFDNRYVSHFSGKKKRQHKRKVLTKKEIIQKSSNVAHIDIENYSPMESIKPMTIPSNKALSYSTKGYFKRHKYGIDIISGNEIDKDIEYISTLTYGNSNALDYNPVFKNAYRHKRAIRQYNRNMKFALPKTELNIKVLKAKGIIN